MACHTDLNTLAMERLSAIVLMSTEQEKENQALRVKVQQLELKVKVQQLDSDRAKLENELQDAQSRENPVSDSLHQNPRLSNLIAANSEQEPISQRRQQKRWFPKKFIPYPAPMGDIKKCLQKHPGFLRDIGSMTWTLPEEDAAIKYILAGDIDEPNFNNIAILLRENENAGLDGKQQRSPTAIRTFWNYPGRERSRCARFCNKFQPIQPARDYTGTKNRLRILKEYYNDKAIRMEEESRFQRRDLRNPRPHGDAVGDADIVMKYGQQGCSSHHPDLNVYQCAYEKAYTMPPHLWLKLKFPELESLLDIRATMAFNPLVTLAQCRPIFQSIDQYVTEWQQITLSSEWLSDLSNSERSKKKTEYAERWENFLDESGCKLWFHQFPDPPEDVSSEPAKQGLEQATASQRCASSTELAAENDGDSIGKKESDADDDDYLGPELPNSIKEETEEGLARQPSCSEEEVGANLSEAHGGSIVAGSTPRRHMTGAARSERICDGLNQNGDISPRTRAIRNGNPAVRNTIKALSIDVRSATENDDNDGSEILTDDETRKAEEDNKVYRGGHLGGEFAEVAYQSDGGVSTLGVGAMSLRSKERGLNTRGSSKPSGRLAPPPPPSSSRSQANGKRVSSPGNSPPNRKNRKIS